MHHTPHWIAGLALVGGLILPMSEAGCRQDNPASSGTAAPTAAPGSQSDEPIQDRIAYARKLLEEAGFPGGKGFPKLEVLYNTDEAHKKVAAALQQMWRKNLGIEVELRNSEWKVYLDDQTKLRYQIVRRGWIGDYLDPNTFIELFTSWSGNNNTGWANPDFDRLVKAASAEPDAAKRLGFLHDAEKILMHDLPVLPLYFYVTKNMWRDNVKGIYHTAQDIHPFNEAYVEGKDMLTVDNHAEPQTLDPTLSRGNIEHHLVIAQFEGLTRYDPRTLAPLPGVAEKWEVSPDGKTYTFHLRDCSWSDGKKVVADDFVYAWTRMLDPNTPTDYAHLHYFIKGAEAFNQKKTSDPASLGLHAPDARTFVVELEHPCTFFLSLCAFQTYVPLRKDVIAEHGANWTKPENIVVNGPFKLKSWKPTDSIIVEKNPTYWEAAKVKSQKIRFLPFDNTTTTWNLYKEGEIDFLMFIPLEQIEEIMKRPDYRGDTYLASYFYGFNTTDGVLKDRRVRKALALAVDRDILVTRITKQGQKPAYNITPPGFPGYTAPRLDVKD